jgi:hypothetical protein
MASTQRTRPEPDPIYLLSESREEYVDVSAFDAPDTGAEYAFGDACARFLSHLLYDTDDGTPISADVAPNAGRWAHERVCIVTTLDETHDAYDDITTAVEAEFRLFRY